MIAVVNYFLIKKQIKKLQDQIDLLKDGGVDEQTLYFLDIMMDLLVLERDHYKNKMFYQLNGLVIITIGLAVAYHFGLFQYIFG